MTTPADAISRTAAEERIEELLGMLDRITAIAAAGKAWIGPDGGENNPDLIALNLFESISREAHNAEPLYTLQRYVQAGG